MTPTRDSRENRLSFFYADRQKGATSYDETDVYKRQVLRQYLDTLKGQYSHILIDCQPSLGMLTVNALAAANRIIIPVQAEYRRIVKAVIYHRKRKGRSLHNRGYDQSLIRKYFLMNGNG